MECFGENGGGFFGEFCAEGFEIVGGGDFDLGHGIDWATVEAFFHFHNANCGRFIAIEEGLLDR